MATASCLKTSFSVPESCARAYDSCHEAMDPSDGRWAQFSSKGLPSPREAAVWGGWDGLKRRSSGEEEGFPEEIQLALSRTSAKKLPELFWCSRTQMWHCRVGVELQISLLPTRCPQAGTFSLALSSPFGILTSFGTDHQDSKLQMEKDFGSDTFSCRWTTRYCGQIDFHAKWLDGRLAYSGRSNTRVFANTASLCVHPVWQDADPATCELLGAARIKLA